MAPPSAQEARTSGDVRFRAACDQTAAGPLGSKWHELRDASISPNRERDQGPTHTWPPRARHRSACEELTARVIIVKVTASREPEPGCDLNYGQRADPTSPRQSHSVVECVGRSDGSVEPRKLHRVISSGRSKQRRECLQHVRSGQNHRGEGGQEDLRTSIGVNSRVEDASRPHHG